MVSIVFKIFTVEFQFRYYGFLALAFYGTSIFQFSTAIFQYWHFPEYLLVYGMINIHYYDC